MKALLVSGLVIVVSAVLLALVRRERRRRPDPVWQPSGVVQRFSGYDEAKAFAAKRRDRHRLKQRITAIRRHAGKTPVADVVSLESRRRAR